MGCHGNMHLHIARIRFFFRIKKLCIHRVLMNNLPPMKNCPGVGGARYVILDPRVIRMEKNLVGGVTSCTKSV